MNNDTAQSAAWFRSTLQSVCEGEFAGKGIVPTSEELEAAVDALWAQIKESK